MRLQFDVAVENEIRKSDIPVERALAVVDAALAPQKLGDLQELVFCRCWCGYNYQQIAEELGYDPGYIRIVGARLWQCLSEAFGERATKSNVGTVVRQRLQDADAFAPALAQASFAQPAPSPSERIPEFPGGYVPLDSPFYMPRPEVEARCYREILQPGAFIQIEASARMGKTSLLNRTLAQAQAWYANALRLGLQELDADAFDSTDRFLRCLSQCVAWRLGLEPQLERYWSGDGDVPKLNCTRYFETYILPQLEGPLALGLDEVERLLAYPALAQEFMSLLRAWYEKARESAVWAKLRLVVACSTEAYVQCGIDQSLFNVGLPIELSDWSFQQVRDLALRYGLSWVQQGTGEQQLRVLVDLVGGHPYLIQLALYYVWAGNTRLEDLLAQAPTESGIYRNHLHQHWETLCASPELAEAMKAVVSSQAPVELPSQTTYKLYGMGLVQLEGDRAAPRCQLYRQYFSERL